MPRKALTEAQIINKYVDTLRFAKDLLVSHAYRPTDRITYILDSYPRLVSIPRTHLATLCGVSREHLSRTIGATV